MKTLVSLTVWGLLLAHSFGQSQDANAKSDWFTLDPGDLWAFEDPVGKMSIRVLEEIEVAEGKGRAHKVGWFMEGQEAPYQVEYWRKDGPDYLVVGREIAGRVLIFDEPYLFLTESVKPGDTWQSAIKFGGRELVLNFSAGEKETIETGVGTFEAIKISVKGPPQSVERWYAPKIGMVKEITRLTLGGRTSPGNEKVLKRHEDGAEKSKGEKEE